MKDPTKRLGRPRSYNPDQALREILKCFWKSGYSGTSLDAIAEATGMNRPSLYAAFGDKEAMYLKSLAHYWDAGFSAMREALSTGVSLREALMAVYEEALSIYFSGNGRSRGCFAIGTALTESVDNRDIRHALADGLRVIDHGFEESIRAARASGELPSDIDPATLAMMASATLHSIAVRARAGASRDELRQFARDAIVVICR